MLPSEWLQWGCNELSALIFYLFYLKMTLLSTLKREIATLSMLLSPLKEAVSKTKTKRIQLFRISIIECAPVTVAHMDNFGKHLGCYPMKQQITRMPLSTLKNSIVRGYSTYNE